MDQPKASYLQLALTIRAENVEVTTDSPDVVPTFGTFTTAIKALAVVRAALKGWRDALEVCQVSGAALVLK
ncbi:hypothetical protein [Curtobacterium sp. UNCCL17]|uniref:hypothetical protein n=1 Tax=Curtobacterium sp. UNCCL17 TaxID=1449051 RepID=UPI00055A4F19|nr:hypothetical protein [Curtobacterium sp. UNCCL17]